MNISQAQPALLTNCGITLSGSLPTPTTHRQVRVVLRDWRGRGYGPVEKREEQGGRQKSFPPI
jgi:hypothetical protein